MKKLFGVLGVAALASTFVLSANATSASPAEWAVSYGYSQGYGQGPEWGAPPREFDEIARRGFRDGIEGARKDYGNHRRPDVNNRDEFRHPNLPRHLREAYRRGFDRGYHVGVEHFYNGR